MDKNYNQLDEEDYKETLDLKIHKVMIINKKFFETTKFPDSDDNQSKKMSRSL